MKKIILGVLILFLLVAGCSQPAWTTYADEKTYFVHISIIFISCRVHSTSMDNL